MATELTKFINRNNKIKGFVFCDSDFRPQALYRMYVNAIEHLRDYSYLIIFGNDGQVLAIFSLYDKDGTYKIKLMEKS